MRSKKVEECMICFPDECTCSSQTEARKKKQPLERPASRVTLVEVELPKKNVTHELSDEEKLLSMALFNLKPLLKQSEIVKYSGIIPARVPAEWEALAWRKRKERNESAE